MTVKQWLMQAREMDSRITYKQMQLEQLRALAEKTTSTVTDVPGSTPDPHRKENLYIKIAELTEEINQEIDALVDRKREILKTIKQLDHEEHRDVIELRYCCGLSWPRVAAAMGYDLRYVHKLHGRALQKIIFNDAPE